MATTDLITELNTDIKNAYDVIAAKGGLVPSNKNTNNLFAAVSSIPQESSGEVTSSNVTVTTIKMFDDNGTPTGEETKLIDYCLPEYGSSLPSACQTSLARSTVQVPLAGYRTAAILKQDFISFTIKGIVDLIYNGFCGGNSQAYGYMNLELIDLSGCIPIEGSTLGVGRYFCAHAKNLKAIKLPLVGCDCDNTYFMHGCDNFTGTIYIPENSNPPTDNNSLSTNNPDAPMYVQGIKLTGPGAGAWKEALPDRDEAPFRKLVVV